MRDAELGGFEMQSNIAVETGDHIAQIENILFKKFAKPNGDNYFMGNKNIVTGHIKQLSFRGKIVIEQMDYSFLYPVSRQYHTQVPFIELLYLDSGKIVNRDSISVETLVNAGIHIYLNTGEMGELVFSPDVPVKGIRIIVREEFYNGDLKERFPFDNLNIDNIKQLTNQNHSNPELQLIFNQIKKGIEVGIRSELFYESKISELLFLIASKNSNIFLQAQNNKHKLTNNDLFLVNKAKAMIDNNLSRNPKISDLAKFTNISAAKLQLDFQSAFNCTIHDYVQKARMGEALRMIENTDDPLKKIAKEVGCKNPSRFAEIFKFTFGVLPRDYRNSHRK
jgi:AraC-like DNA-binding protein